MINNFSMIPNVFFKVLMIKQTVQQDKDVTLLINMYENILNINKNLICVYIHYIYNLKAK